MEASDLDTAGEVRTVSESADAVRVALHGEADVALAGDLRVRLRELLVAGRTTVVVDLSAVTFMDSSALGVLVNARRQARVFRGSLTLADPSPPVRRLLAVTALDRVFEVRDTPAAEA